MLCHPYLGMTIAVLGCQRTVGAATMSTIELAVRCLIVVPLMTLYFKMGVYENGYCWAAVYVSTPIAIGFFFDGFGKQLMLVSHAVMLLMNFAYWDNKGPGGKLIFPLHLMADFGAVSPASPAFDGVATSHCVSRTSNVAHKNKRSVSHSPFGSAFPAPHGTATVAVSSNHEPFADSDGAASALASHRTAMGSSAAVSRTAAENRMRRRRFGSSSPDAVAGGKMYANVSSPAVPLGDRWALEAELAANGGRFQRPVAQWGPAELHTIADLWLMANEDDREEGAVTSWCGEANRGKADSAADVAPDASAEPETVGGGSSVPYGGSDAKTSLVGEVPINSTASFRSGGEVEDKARDEHRRQRLRMLISNADAEGLHTFSFCLVLFSKEVKRLLMAAEAMRQHNNTIYN